MNSEHTALTDDLFTHFCDKDAQWGPLLFLRPSRHQRLGLGRSLALAMLPGVLFGLAGSVLLTAIARQLDKPLFPVYIFPLVLTLIYFVVCQLTIVPAWNRRAARLVRSEWFHKRPPRD